MPSRLLPVPHVLRKRRVKIRRTITDLTSGAIPAENTHSRACSNSEGVSSIPSRQLPVPSFDRDHLGADTLAQVKRMRSLKASFALVLSLCVASGCGSGSLDAETKIAASALFADFETVSKANVSRLPFHLMGGQEPYAEIMLFRPFSYLFSALDSLGNSTAQELIGRTDVVIGGAGHFHAPTGLGAVSSRNCYILLVKPGFDLARYTARPATENWRGKPLWKWTAALGEYGEGDPRSSTIFALQHGSYVLISNDAERIVRIAEHVVAGEDGTKSATIPAEWPELSRSDYWVYRRYRFGDVTDPMAAGVDGVRKDAVALMFITEQDGKSAILRLASASPVAKQPEVLIEQQPFPHLSPVTPHSWEASLATTGGEQNWTTLFFVMGLMGFAVYL